MGDEDERRTPNAEHPTSNAALTRPFGHHSLVTDHQSPRTRQRHHDGGLRRGILLR